MYMIKRSIYANMCELQTNFRTRRTKKNLKTELKKHKIDFITLKNKSKFADHLI
jgi:hypothetical protein